MMQTKLTEENAKRLDKAADIIAQAFAWNDTDEGNEYWDEVYENLRMKAANGTSDGKPYVEPEPPIPEGYRKANADEWKRMDVKLWNYTSDTWVLRPLQGCSFDPPDWGTRYIVPIVPIDPPLTDEDACVWPRRLVMVRDNDTERERWKGPFQYVGKLDDKPFPFVVYREDGLPCVWKQARRATPEEIEAAK